MKLKHDYVGKPWERQRCDTQKSWAAFQLYLEMGRHRSIRKVAESMGYKSTRWMEAWSSNHHWKERSEAWDIHKAELRRQKHEQEHAKQLQKFVEDQKEFHQEARKAARQTMEAANKMLKKLLEDGEIPVKSLPSFLRAAAAVAESANEAEAAILGVHEILSLIDEES